MAVRSVSVRYSASVGQLVSELSRAERANARLGAAADAAARRQDQSATRMAKGGAVIALGLGVAVAKFAEFDAAMSGAAAASSATGSELNNLRDAAVKAGADTQYSATEAANAITELSKAGVSTADILSGGLTGALNLAAAGQMDVAEAAETAATAMTQFGLKGDQVNHIADLLAAGAGKAQGSVSDMGMALKQAGLVANQTGLSIEETTAGLTAFASAGLIGSDAGTSMKSMLQRLTPQSKEAAGLMQELGISAYDASGNFIGLEQFAGNLRTSLQDLTPEQRNAALATIFGSDAVRAASVLYEQGATGIAKWTDEVNQQGYAAKQAATLTDNLKGDIERLGGAFDTALIQGGSGANDTLRTLVQTGESLIEVIGAIPGPVLTGAAAFGALALLGPKVGNLARTVTGPLTSGIAGFRAQAALAQAGAVGYGAAVEGAGQKSLTAGQRISTSFKALGGLKGAAGGVMGLLGGPWGLALTAATAGVTMWAQSQADARAAADALSATIDEQTGKFTDQSVQTVLSSFTDALAPEDIGRLQALGINLNEAADAALKGGPALEAYRARITALSSDTAGFLGTADSRALDGFNAALGRSGDAALAAATKQEVLNQAKNRQLAADSAGAGSSAAAERGLTAVGDAAGDTGAALDAAGTKTDATAELMAKLGAKSEEAQAQIDGLSQALDLLGGGTRAVAAASDAQAASIDKVAEAAQKATEASQKKTSGDYTAAEKTRDVAEAHRQYRAALRDVATDTLTLIDKQQAQNVSVTTLQSSYDKGRSTIEGRLKLSGLHGAALQRETDKIIGTRADFNLLLDAYRKTPGQVATTVKANGTPTAKSNVQGVIDKLRVVAAPWTATVNANVSTAISRVQALQAELAATPRNITTTMTVRRIQNDIRLEQNGVASAVGNLVTAYAGGGMDVPNGHVAEIATSGIRMWAEPETKGEAYIPLADDWRRPRARAIASETVKRLGGDVSWFAGGGISSYAAGGVRAPLDQYYGDYMQSLGEQVTNEILAGLKAASKKALSDLGTLGVTAANRRRNNDAALAKDQRAITEARADVRSARTNRERAAAQKKLADAQAKYEKDRRNFAAAEMKDDKAIAAGKDKLLKANRAVLSAQNRQRVQGQSALTRFGRGLAGGVKNTSTFIANIEKLASRGFGTLAANLAEMGNEDAEKIAAEAANASTADLTKLQNTVAVGAQQQKELDHIGTITAILSQVKSKNLTARQMSAVTGIDPMEILDSVEIIKGKLAGNRNASKLLADLAKRSSGQLFYSGGYTGDGGKYDPAGIVHRGEVVFEQEAVSRHGLGPLQALRTGRARIVPGFSGGGLVGAATVSVGGSSFDYMRLGREIARNSGNTYQAYGTDSEAAMRRLMREEELRKAALL